ncbi:MAG: hypothetical protein ABFS02_12920 [Pseudomonadota bacterium]
MSFRLLERIRFLLRITHSHGIARRYFVVNGFDGALTMLGLIMGFFVSESVTLSVVITACLGAAIALAMSGLTSAYISESAERKRSLSGLEEAMAKDLHESAHGQAARWVPFLIAAINGLAPFMICLLIISPLWIAKAGFWLPLEPLMMAITIAFALIFFLGVFLGQVSGTFWLLSGLQTLLVALTTVGLVLILGNLESR